MSATESINQLQHKLSAVKKVKIRLVKHDLSGKTDTNYRVYATKVTIIKNKIKIAMKKIFQMCNTKTLIRLHSH